MIETPPPLEEGGPVTRLQICDALAAAGCTTVGFEYNGDDHIERAYHAWLAEGSPRFAVVITAREEGPHGGKEVVIIEEPKSFDLE